MTRIFIVGVIALSLCGCGVGIGVSDKFEVMRANGVALVLERADVSNEMRNATVRRGSFFLANGCVGVLIDGVPYTPILPGGTTLASDTKSLRIGPAKVAFGPIFRLPFANEVEVGADSIRRALRLPDECPPCLMRMGAPSPI